MRILELAFSGMVGTRRMGPVSNDILQLSNRFAAGGHEVILADVTAENPRELLHPAIRVIELPEVPESKVNANVSGRLPRLIRRWRSAYRYVRALAARVDLNREEIVHCHSAHTAYLIQRLYRPRTAYTSHNTFPVQDLGAAPSLRRRVGKALNPFHRLNVGTERAVILRSDVTISLGDFLAAAVNHPNIVTIPNGIDLLEWPSLDLAEARQATNLSADAFVLLFVGRLNPIKGVHVLLDALERVANRVPGIQVIAIGPLSGSFDTGDSSTTSYAAAQIERAKDLPIRFLGFISNRSDKFRQYLAAADLFVLPSLWEPQGVVVLESLAMGTPVIASDVGGIPHMVNSDVGYLFPPGDAEALANRILEAHSDRVRLRRMSDRARERVEANFSWDHAAERHLVEFERLLRASGA